ncbi:hypothetical protein [Streptomyces decoyicus]|uniref:hypothetical protein n=1 Tax=Streptomyces decoyicus TaxID=249567 RepID=UPI003F4B4247
MDAVGGDDEVRGELRTAVRRTFDPYARRMVLRSRVARVDERGLGSGAHRAVGQPGREQGDHLGAVGDRDGAAEAPEYDRAGRAFREPVVALLAAAGSADPERHALSMVAWSDGVLFSCIAGQFHAAVPTRDALRTSCTELLDGMLRR